MARIKTRLGKLEAAAAERTRGDIKTFICAGEPSPELLQEMEAAEADGFSVVLAQFTGKNYFEDYEPEPGSIF